MGYGFQGQGQSHWENLPTERLQQMPYQIFKLLPRKVDKLNALICD
ncbi:hypothetical protein SAMN05444679_1402 [Variovorax sp. CF079]|nr:hypothetical protein SAMN05444679_1402 [Variovorax sp. CF079]